MQPLNLYFNELSAPPPDITAQELRSWPPWALSLIATLKKVRQTKLEYTLVFQPGHFHATYANKPLSVWLREWVSKDQYRWILGKIRDVSQDQAGLLYQVYFQDQQTIGLTLASIAKSWAFSFPVLASPWLDSTVVTTEYRESGDDVIERSCTIMHLSNEQHVLHWQQEMSDWGRDIANNNTITRIAGYPIVMYPLDHGYPHVHIVDPHHFKTLAKFRVDQFEQMGGPPQWDANIKVLIDRNQDELIQSWKRCQCGDHPYQVAENV